MGVILDSGILIAAERKGNSVLQILEQVRASYGEVEIGLSVVSIAELTHGAYRTREEWRKLRRLTFIDRLCSDIPVFPITVDLARRIGQIEGQQAALGFGIAFEDLAIGVTALSLGYDIVTLNEKHFKLIPGLKIRG
jgi:predicted nucleic acid-binding protein